MLLIASLAASEWTGKGPKHELPAIAELSVDIIGLQEIDLSRQRSAEIDQAGAIAEQLGWQEHFHSAIRSGDEHYGHAPLSRYRLSVPRATCLPSVAPFFCRESLAAIAMDVTTDFGSVHITNTHFGLGRRERLLQAESLTSADWLDANSGDSVLILLRDLNSLAGSRPHLFPICNAKKHFAYLPAESTSFRNISGQKPKPRRINDDD